VQIDDIATHMLGHQFGPEMQQIQTSADPTTQL
jgi:hypothetical protein